MVMFGRRPTQWGYVDDDARATRVTVVEGSGEDGSGVATLLSTVVVTGIADGEPVMVLPADPARVHALLVTDAAVAMFIGPDDQVSTLNGFPMVFGFSGLFPIPVVTTGEVWAINASGEGVQNTIRALVGRRVNL